MQARRIIIHSDYHYYLHFLSLRELMEKIKNLALVAHDNRKADLIEWVEWNYESIMQHKLICTGTTGALIEESLKKKIV